MNVVAALQSDQLYFQSSELTKNYFVYTPFGISDVMQS
jgi:hypothetical protein